MNVMCGRHRHDPRVLVQQGSQFWAVVVQDVYHGTVSAGSAPPMKLTGVVKKPLSGGVARAAVSAALPAVGRNSYDVRL